MLRYLLPLSLLLSNTCASADETEIVGVWKLKSFTAESVQTKERQTVYGENPKGYLVVTPERFTAVITAEGRKPPKTDEDRLFSFRTMFAYTGPYRIEGDRIMTKVEVSWNEDWTDTNQVRIFHIEGEKLLIETVPALSPNDPSLGVVKGILEWERSK